MYPRNAASPERIAIGAVVQISDGAVQTSGVSITVRGQGGSEGAGSGTTAYGASGIVYYTPTQGETDFTSFVVIASKTGCVPVAQTIVTSASATPGYAGTDQSKIANATATVDLSGTTVKTATDIATAVAAVPSATANADALLGRNVAGGSSSGRTVKEALYFLRNRWVVSSGTLTVYGTDDTTSAWTSTVTQTAGNPVSESNPA